MLELSTWPPLKTVEVSQTLSNGRCYTLFFSQFGWQLEYKLVSSDIEIELRCVSKKILNASYEAFCNAQPVLKIHSGINDYVEIDHAKYRITGLAKRTIGRLNFHCISKPFLIGHEMRASFPETFELQGVILVSYLIVKQWLKEG